MEERRSPYNLAIVDGDSPTDKMLGWHRRFLRCFRYRLGDHHAVARRLRRGAARRVGGQRHRDHRSLPYWLSFASRFNAKGGARRYLWPDNRSLARKRFKEGADVQARRALAPAEDQGRASDYKGSGHDLGHMAPAEDFAWSKTLERETFSMASVEPQLPCLNRQGWERIEEIARTEACRHGAAAIFLRPCSSRIHNNRR